MALRKPKHCARTTFKGRVAAYCPICRDIQPFDLGFEKEGIGREPIWICECADCGVRLRCNPSEWQTLASASVSDVPKLLELTAPDYLYYVYDRCFQDIQLASGLSPPAARMAEIKDVLALGCAYFADHCREDYLSGSRALTLVCAAVGILTGLVLSEGKGANISDSSRLIGKVVMIASGVSAGLLYAWWGWRRAKHAAAYARFLVAKSLRPFSPTIDEIDACVRAIALIEPRVNLFAHPARLHAELARLTDRSWSNVTPDVAKASAETVHLSRLAAMQEVHV